MLVVVYEVLLVVHELSGGICQIYSPALVWDDVTTIVYSCILYVCIHCHELYNMGIMSI